MSKISKFFFGNKGLNILNNKQKANVVGGRSTTTTHTEPIDDTENSANSNNSSGNGD